MPAGTWTLIKLIFRRDCVKLPIWVVGIVGTLLAMVPLLRDVYGDAETIGTLYYSFSANPAGLFLTGPMDGPTFGSLVTIETLLWWGLAVAFMNTLLVIRHTRHNEELGAQELIVSGRVHRAAGLAAALIVAFVVNLTVTLGLGCGLSAIAGGSWGSSEAWLYALSMGLFGFVWAGIAAVVAQLVESARSANGVMAGCIGAAFVLRGIGDFMAITDANGLLQPTWVSSLSPFGWLQATRSLTFPEWQPLILPVIAAGIAIAAAFVLLSRRDVGAGILPARKGRPRASVFLKTPLGLTWRLQKNVFFGWLAGVVAMIATIGLLVPEMSHVYENSDSMKGVITAIGGTGALIPTFLSAMLSIVALLVVAYSIQALIKLRSEEASGHLENLLATRLSRVRWLGMHVTLVICCGAIMLALSGAGLVFFVNISSDIHVSLVEYLLAGLSYLPLLLAFIGTYVLLFGFAPRFAGLLSWLYYGFVFFALWLGPILRLDQWILDLSLTSHISAAPAEAVRIVPLVVMTSAALALLGIGTMLWRRRNLLGKT